MKELKNPQNYDLEQMQNYLLLGDEVVGGFKKRTDLRKNTCFKTPKGDLLKVTGVKRILVVERI